MSGTEEDIKNRLDGALQAQRTQDALNGGATVGGASVQYGVEQKVRQDTASNSVALGNTAEDQRIKAQTEARRDAVLTSNKAQASNLDVQRSIEASVLQRATLSERLQAGLFGFLDFIGQAIFVLTKPGDFFTNIREALNGLRNFTAPTVNTSTAIEAGTVSGVGVNYTPQAEERRAVGSTPSPRPSSVSTDKLARQYGTGAAFLDVSTGQTHRPAAPDVVSTPARPLVLPAPAPAP